MNHGLFHYKHPHATLILKKNLWDSHQHHQLSNFRNQTSTKSKIEVQVFFGTKLTSNSPNALGNKSTVFQPPGTPPAVQTLHPFFSDVTDLTSPGGGFFGITAVRKIAKILGVDGCK
jgi:hypothetical protein